jgi:hypothetical protein
VTTRLSTKVDRSPWAVSLICLVFCEPVLPFICPRCRLSVGAKGDDPVANRRQDYGARYRRIALYRLCLQRASYSAHKHAGGHTNTHRHNTVRDAVARFTFIVLVRPRFHPPRLQVT